MRRNLPSIVAAIVLVAIFLAYMISYQLRFTERAVVITFWPYSQVAVEEPGLHFRWPYPIQEVHTYDMRIRVFEDVEEQVTTSDQKQIIVITFVGWRPDDVVKFHNRMKGDMEKAERLLRGLMRDQKGVVVGRYDLANFVSTDPQELRFEQIEQDLLGRLRSVAMDEYGIEIASVGIRRLGLPEKTTEDIFKAMRAERQRIAERYTARGNAEAATIRNQAVAARDKILAFANRLAEDIRAQGNRDAAAYYEAFKTDEAFAAFLKELDFLKQALSKRAIYVLPTEKPGGRLFTAEQPTLPDTTSLPFPMPSQPSAQADQEEPS
jgi:membrane protease subunit HflC